jgi:hypothetical protein
MLPFPLMIPISIGPAMAFMLIALGVGYLVVVKGDKEKGFLRALGLILGFFIVVMSFFMVLMYSNIMRIEREIAMMKGSMMQQAPSTIMPMRPRMMRR